MLQTSQSSTFGSIPPPVDDRGEQLVRESSTQYVHIYISDERRQHIYYIDEVLYVRYYELCYVQQPAVESNVVYECKIAASMKKRWTTALL